MKKVKRWIKKYIGELFLIIGSFITTYNVFNFSSDYYGGGRVIGGLPSLELQVRESTDPAVYYYYHNNTLFWLSFGVALIVIGILIVRAKKK